MHQLPQQRMISVSSNFIIGLMAGWCLPGTLKQNGAYSQRLVVLGYSEALREFFPTFTT
jgi:hypothetical protein